MAEVSESIIVDAPVSAVFAFMDVPENQVAVTPALRSVRNVNRLENGGKRIEYTYGMAGVELNGAVTATEYVPEERVTFAMTGAIEGEIRWTFASVSEGTEVTYAADYETPVAAVERVAGAILDRFNRRQAKKTLENVKEAVEGNGTDEVSA